MPETVLSKTKSKDRDGLHRRRGIWFFGIRDPIDGKWKEFSTHTKSFTDARTIRSQRMTELAAGALNVDKRKLIMSQAFGIYILDAAMHCSPKSIKTHMERSVPLLKVVGKMRLGEITIDTVRDYQQKRSGKVANRTINLEVQTLRNTLTHNQLWKGRLLEDYKSLPEGIENVGRVLEDDEEQRCWEVAKKSQHSMRTYNVSVFCGNTGVRTMELLTFRLDQIDLDRGELWVNKSKTNAGRRYIPLNEHAIVAATILVELAGRKGAHEPDHYLFPAFLHRRRKAGETRSGYDPTQHQKTMRTAWRNFTRKAGLRGLRIHDRRHHFITALAEAGVPIETAMTIVGHMSKEMTRHYTHIRDGVKRDVVNQIDPANVVSTDEIQREYATAKKRSRISDESAGTAANANVIGKGKGKEK